MIAGLAITAVFAGLIWLVFFGLRLLRFTIGWGILCGFFGLHLLLIFLIGMRFSAPASVDATIVQPTIQLTPRLTEPTLVAAVLVEEGAQVRRGQPLFRFDDTIYAAKVRSLEAQLAAAQQTVRVLQVDVAIANDSLTQARDHLTYLTERRNATAILARSGDTPQLRADQWEQSTLAQQAVVFAAEASLRRAVLQLESQVDGVNTTVAQIQADLDQARFYLANTIMVAPEDGRIVNLQVRPGMVAGDLRIGAIAALIVDADRYLLATYWQQHLRWVVPGQPVEVALDLYPGQVFQGRVTEIWNANALGQFLPSAQLPAFNARDPHAGMGLFALRVEMNGADAARFPIGAHGQAAVFTGNRGFEALRRISLRGYSWLNWLNPISF
jgi:multidrug resistance efflux pump